MYNPIFQRKADGDGSSDYSQFATPGGNSLDDNSGAPPPPPGASAPTPTGGGGGGGGFQLPGFVQDQMNNFSGALSNPMMLPGLAAAAQQFHQSREYTEMAERYADRLDPFGHERAGYQDRLRNVYDHPDQVLQDPAHQRAMQLGLDNVARQKASQGYLGSGNMLMALADYQRAGDEKYLSDMRHDLAPLTGSQFGPETSGHMLEAGLAGRMGAENNAIGNLIAPFANQSQVNRDPNRNPNGGGPNGPMNNGRTPTAQDILNRASNPSGPGGGPRSAAEAEIARRIAAGIRVDENDPLVRQAIIDNSPSGFYNGMPDPYKDPAGYDRWLEQNNENIMNNYGGTVTSDPYPENLGGYDNPGSYGDNPFANYELPPTSVIEWNPDDYAALFGG